MWIYSPQEDPSGFYFIPHLALPLMLTVTDRFIVSFSFNWLLQLFGMESWDSTVGIVTGYRLDDQGIGYLQYCKPQMGMIPKHWSKGKGKVEIKHWIAELYSSPSPRPLSIHFPRLHYYIVLYVRVNRNWFPRSFWPLPTKAKAY
jgi:hypothetical protein